MQFLSSLGSIGRTVACVVAVGVAGAAQAAPCPASAIGARFSEAAKLCGEEPAPLTDAASGSTALATAPALAGARVVVPETSAPVSISMPGYSRRLAAAVRQVHRSSDAAGRVPNDALMVAVGRRYRVDPHLLASIMSAESAGNMSAISNKGALGLMQVMPATARSMGVRDPRQLLTDRALALSAGAAYLKHLQRQFGNNLPLVVAAYNAGPGAVVKYRGIPRYRETQTYVGRVMSRYSARTGATR